MKRLGTVLAILMACTRADTLELKTGERLEGTFKQATSAGAVIEVGGQNITVPLDKLRAVYFGSAPKPFDNVSPADESMRALKGLQSITMSGVSLREYSPRVLDAKVKVDQYLSSPVAGDEKVRGAISVAMRYYELASNVWPLTITPLGRWTAEMLEMDRRLGLVLREEKELATCPAIASVLKDADATNERLVALAKIEAQKKPRSQDPSIIRGAQSDHVNPSLRLRPQILWGCASSKIGEAERSFAQR
jgi:hypothetical protein